MLTIAEAGRRFRDGSLSPVAFTEECLARIGELNPELNAFWEVFAEEARASSARAEEELRGGRDRGPLHGIPIGVKDLYDMAGHVTTAGAHPSFHPPPAKEDCEVVRRLREAGAVLLGKTALHEWAMGVTTNNPHFGPTRNPRDRDRIPGGSSGGSAAALASGMCPGALGSDTGGSIRMPAGLCGVYGLKPTYGSVSMRGVWPLSVSLDTAGPMANSVEDCFLMLEAMSDFRRRPAPKPRILIASNYFFEEVHPLIERRIREAARRLGPLEEVEVGDPKGAWEANLTILQSEAAVLHRERLEAHPERFGADMASRLRAGLEKTREDRDRAREVQREWTAFLDGLLGSDALLAVPATCVPATEIGDREGIPISRLLTRFTAPFNLAGVPILTVPAGEVEGLPVGMQLVASRGNEKLLATMIK